MIFTPRTIRFMASPLVVAVCACTGITDATGLTVQQQTCIANTWFAIQDQQPWVDQSYAQRAAYVAETCGIAQAEVQEALAAD